MAYIFATYAAECLITISQKSLLI